LRHVRSFYLVKQGAARADSRSAAGLACDIRASIADVGPSGSVAIEAVVTNTGTATWLPSGTSPGGVALGAHLYDESGGLESFDFQTWPLTDAPREIAPGEVVTRRVTLPKVAPGRHRVELDCVAEHVTWFAQAGSRTVVMTLNVADRTRGDRRS